MTKEICSHHFWLSVWLALDIIVVIGLSFSALDPIKYNFQYVNEDYGASEAVFITELNHNKSINDFYLILFFTVCLNLIGLFFGNMRYEWIRLKDCSL